MRHCGIEADQLRDDAVEEARIFDVEEDQNSLGDRGCSQHLFYSPFRHPCEESHQTIVHHTGRDSDEDE